MRTERWTASGVEDVLRIVKRLQSREYRASKSISVVSCQSQNEKREENQAKVKENQQPKAITVTDDTRLAAAKRLLTPYALLLQLLPSLLSTSLHHGDASTLHGS